MHLLRLALAGFLCVVLCGAVSCANSGGLAQLPEPRSDAALVFFYREAPPDGPPLPRVRIYRGGALITSLRNGAFTYVYVPPGLQRFVIETKIRQDVPIPLEAGRSYFARVSIAGGVYLADPKLELVPEQQGRTAIAKLEYDASQPAP